MNKTQKGLQNKNLHKLDLGSPIEKKRKNERNKKFFKSESALKSKITLVVGIMFILFLGVINSEIFYNKYQEVLDQTHKTTNFISQGEGVLTLRITFTELPAISRTNMGDIFAIYNNGERILLAQNEEFI